MTHTASSDGVRPTQAPPSGAQPRRDRHRGVPRRSVLAAAPIAAVAGIGLAACGSDDTSSDASTDASSPSTAGDDVLAKTADVPVGGAKVVGDVVVTQAAAGTFAAFSTKCTHMGCTVAPKADKLDCPCHGSEFALDGAVVHGPASRPLEPVAVRVEGENIVRG